MVERDNVNESMDSLMHKDTYTPEELSDLTGIGLYTIQSAVHGGELPARMVEHDILDIRREDAVRWMAQRGGARS